MTPNEVFVIGVDYGTDSVRALIIDAANGKEIATSVFTYPRWSEGKYCNPAKNQFRHHPLDYIEGLESTIKNALKNAPPGAAEKVKGISVDTTGSTPVAVNKDGEPLSLTPGLEENPNAMFILWKDHTSVEEAEEINATAHLTLHVDYTQYSGGVYSSEWFWAKLLHILRIDPVVRRNIFSFVELCDWIPALLTGIKDPLKLKRSRCAAGHKAMWHPSWNGLPPEEFLMKLDPVLKDFRNRLYNETYTSDQKAGLLSPEWAKRLGLREDVVIGVGAFDAHMGAVGGEIEPYTMAKIMGTSTCDILTAPENMMGTKLIKGICGQVDGSVIPGMLGMEAGQSSFGDVYAWFKDLLLWPIESIKVNDKIDPDAKREFVKQISDRIIDQLSEEASKLPIDESGVLAVDWLNGRRTPYANQLLKGAIVGLNLGSNATKIFRALVEATAFGAKKIVDCFMMQDIPINGVIGLGGVAKKSPFILQVVCDVLNIPIKIPKSEQTCALGAAMFAATAAGIYNSIDEAKKAMGSGFEKEYIPNPENAAKYAVLYEKYSRLSSFIEQELTD